MVNGAWVYLVQGAGLLIFSLFCYVSRPDVRRWQLTLSLALTPLGPLGELFFLQDYWHAPFVPPNPSLPTPTPPPLSPRRAPPGRTPPRRLAICCLGLQWADIAESSWQLLQVSPCVRSLDY